MGEDRRPLFTRRRPAEDQRKLGAVEDVVSEAECDVVVADEPTPDDEGPREAVGTRLDRVREIDPELTPVPEQAPGTMPDPPAS